MAVKEAKEAASAAVSTGKSALGTAWKVTKGAATLTGIFSFVALTAGGGSVALAAAASTAGTSGIGLGAWAALPMEGLAETADLAVSGLQQLAGLLPDPV